MAVTADAERRSKLFLTPRDATTNKQMSHRVPVDRGWAWVILAAACITFGLPSGSSRVTGIIYLEMLDRFESDKQLTLWVFSLRYIVTLLLGPLASLVLQKTNHRYAIIIGSVLTAGGTVATGYAPIMELTFITYSTVYGFGIAILLVASLTCTAAYFDRHRGLALGLTTAGSGVVSFIMPQVARELFEQFLFEGALLVYGGMFMHLIVCALLIRPVTSYRSFASGEAAEKDTSREICEDVRQTSHKRPDIGLPTGSRTSLKLDVSHYREMPDLGVSSKLHLPFRKDAKSSFQNGRAQQPMKDKNEIGTLTALKSFSLAHYFGLMKNEQMWMVCIINVLSSNAFTIIFTALPPYGESVGVPRQRTSTLLAIGGAAEIVFRTLHGWLSDRKFISPLLQLGFCSGLMGFFTLICPIVGGELSVGLTSSACGVVGTSIFTLSTVCIRELLGKEHMSSAVGIKMSTQVISVVLSTFVMGYLTKLTGRWDEVFYYMGANLIASSVVTLFGYIRLKRADIKPHPMPSPVP